MGLQLLTVCILIGSVYAQSGEIMSGAQTLNVTRPEAEAAALNATQVAYDNVLATQARRNHFFCVDRETFPIANNGGVLVQFNTFEQNGTFVFSVWLQYPLLAYLDVHRKNVLMEAVVTVLNTGPTAPDVIDRNNLCLGTYETYSLNSFNEGVVIRIYGSTQFNGTEMANRFQSNLMALYRDTSDELVIVYPGQPGVFSFNLSSLDMFDRANALHPGSLSSDMIDPTIYPVIIGAYAGNVTTTNITTNGYPRLPFASNPNPINYYLQVGDYIFLVIGTILLAIVLFLIIFGYCIHPFL